MFFAVGGIQDCTTFTRARRLALCIHHARTGAFVDSFRAGRLSASTAIVLARLAAFNQFDVLTAKPSDGGVHCKSQRGTSRFLKLVAPGLHSFGGRKLPTKVKGKRFGQHHHGSPGGRWVAPCFAAFPFQGRAVGPVHPKRSKQRPPRTAVLRAPVQNKLDPKKFPDLAVSRWLYVGVIVYNRDTVHCGDQFVHFLQVFSLA